MPQFPFKRPPVTQIVAVVCIVGFVAAILFPVFQKVHEHSGPGCSSNMKQLGLAYAQYEQDYGYIYPPGVSAAGNGWANQLYPYTRSRYVYRCRDDSAEAPFISYAENRNISKQHYINFTDASATVALYEFTTLNCDPSQPEAVSATGLSAPQNSTRHDPKTFGLNFLMADGSVKWLFPAQVSDGPGAVSPKSLPSGKIIRTFAVK